MTSYCYTSVFSTILCFVALFFFPPLVLFCQLKPFDSLLCHSEQSYVLAGSPHHSQCNNDHHLSKKAQPNPIQTKQNTTPKPNKKQQKQINSPLHPQPTIPTSQQNQTQTQMKQTKKPTNRITLQGHVGFLVHIFLR